MAKKKDKESTTKAKAALKNKVATKPKTAPKAKAVTKGKEVEHTEDVITEKEEQMMSEKNDKQPTIQKPKYKVV